MHIYNGYLKRKQHVLRRRSKLVGGGLVRSLGGWSEVLPIRRVIPLKVKREFNGVSLII